jgi:hypothetical protein
MREVMSGLVSPRGLAFGPDGGLYVAEAGDGGSGPSIVLGSGVEAFYGPTGGVSRLRGGVQERVLSGLPSVAGTAPFGIEANGLNDIVFDNAGSLYGIIGIGANPAARANLGPPGADFGALVRLPLDGSPFERVADLGAHEAANNPDGGAPDSNPFGLAHLPAGGFLVADAAANAFLSATTGGDVSTLDFLPDRPNPLPFGPPVFQSVPTTIAVGPDNAYYVGELTGFPFPPGAANVYRFHPATSDVSIAHSGFTNIMDLTFDGEGNLYVLQASTNGLGSPMGAGPGMLIKIDAATGDRTTIASEGIMGPGSVAVGPDGTLYVTNRITSAQGQVLSVTPVPEPSPALMAILGVGAGALVLRRRGRTTPASARRLGIVTVLWRQPSASVPRAMAFLLGCASPWTCYAQVGEPFLPGEYGVGHERFEALDAARSNRRVPTMVWYPVDRDVVDGEPIRYPRPFGWIQPSPWIGGLLEAPVADAGPFPLLVLSHGHGGVPQQFELLGEVLASHGYVVAAPQHAGNSAGTPTQSGMASHRPADMSFVIDTMLSRSATPDDLLSGVINGGAIAVGGYSRGAATAAATVAGHTAALAGEFDTPADPRVKALVFIDGTPNTVDQLAPELRERITLPTLSVGSSVGSFAANNSILPVANPFYGTDAIGATHDAFVGFESCHFINGFFESGAPQNVLDVFGINGPVECGPDILPAGDVPEIVARHTTAFLESQFGGDSPNIDVLSPDRENLSGNVLLRARVLGTGTASEWPDLLLTDPIGRQIGVDPQTGEQVSDFQAREISYLVSQSMRGFTMIADQILPGEYVLTGVGNASVAQTRDLQVTLELTEERQFSRVFERVLLKSGQIAAGTALEPLTFEIIPIPALTGDYNANGVVEQADLDLVLLNWGDELIDPAAAGWANDLPSGAIDQKELDSVLLHWGSGDAVAAAGVPEPSSLLLVAMGLVAALTLRGTYASSL